MLTQKTRGRAAIAPRGIARWRRFARATLTASVLLGGQIGVVRTALGMDCARPETRPAAVMLRDDARAYVSEPATESGGEGKQPRLPSALAGASCQMPGSLLPDPPPLAAAVVPNSNPLIEADQKTRSDWKVPPPFHPPRRS